jgi:hypothetical protein
MASEGAAPQVDPGVTILGTGVQTSVSSGFGLSESGLSGVWALRAAVKQDRIATERSRESRVFIDGLEDTPGEPLASV